MRRETHIGIDKDEEWSGGVLGQYGAGVGFAAPARRQRRGLEETDPGIVLGQFCHNGCRGVGGMIIEYKHVQVHIFTR
jgi:hypothetical protein